MSSLGHAVIPVFTAGSMPAQGSSTPPVAGFQRLCTRIPTDHELNHGIKTASQNHRI
jgi:hypothetical protein